MLFIGILAFILFSLNDLNDCFFHSKIVKIFYPAGFLALIISTLLICISSRSVIGIVSRIVFGILGLLSLILLLYSLFGQFNLADSYWKPGEKRPTCTTGMYALCRHPGVLWFVILYVCLHFCFGIPWTSVIVFSVLNVLLALLEDKVIFPNLLEGYESYRKTTPFLIPRAHSIASCMRYYF